MKSKTSGLTASSFSSKKMETLSHSETILQLGERLVREFDLDDSVDTLGRWMVHTIAEKIKAAESSNDQERAIRTSEACDEILKFWSHRQNFNKMHRPLKSFEPIFRALESFDPCSSNTRFYAHVDSTNEDEETTKWLTLAEEIDQSARYLIKQCLKNAAKTAHDKEKDWVKLSSDISANDDDFKTIALLLRSTNYPAKFKKRLSEKLKGLVALSKSEIALLEKRKSEYSPKS